MVSAPKFADLWSNYGRLYNATPAQQQAELGTSFRNPNLVNAHSRCTAFAALHTNNKELAKRAWDELLGNYNFEKNGYTPPRPAQRLEGPVVLNPLDETLMGTNGSQWQLAVMECLALLKTFPREK